MSKKKSELAQRKRIPSTAFLDADANKFQKRERYELALRMVTKWERIDDFTVRLFFECGDVATMMHRDGLRIWDDAIETWMICPACKQLFYGGK